MKTKLSLTALLSFIFCLLSSQVPQGFNYQAIARLTTGDPIINTTLPVRITIQADSLGTSIIWQELHSAVTTNGFGLLTLVLGKGARQAVSTVATFSAINWAVTPKFIKTEISYSGWKTMGVTRFWTVPYSLLSAGLGTVSKLAVLGVTALNDEALFEVKNKDGQTIFAVYNEGVRVFVDDGAKGPKGGFAVGGFGEAKAPSQEYLRVTKDSTRIYVNALAKGPKGGFAVGGFGAKGIIPFTSLTPKNYFIGHEAGLKNTTGVYNSFFGYQAGKANTTGSNNTFIGFNAGLSNTDNNSNVFIGNEAGKASNGYSNVFVGHMSGLANTTGSYNIFMGEFAGGKNTQGTENIFLGYETGCNNLTGGDNVMIGPFCSNTITGGSANIMLGAETANGRTSGDENVFLGSWAGQDGVSGNGNVMVGTNAGYGSSGDKNVIIGYSAGPGSGTISNKLYINNSGTTPLIYGDFTDGSEYLVVNGKLGIGITPSSKLSISGLPGIISGTTLVYSGGNVYYLSSSRESKEDIKPFSDDFEKILLAQPVSFKDRNSDIRGIGYIAEDFEKAGLQNLLVYEGGKLVSLRYDLISVYNLEIIKQQQSRIATVEQENLQLKSEMQLLKDEMDQIKSMLTAK